MRALVQVVSGRPRATALLFLFFLLTADVIMTSVLFSCSDVECPKAEVPFLLSEETNGVSSQSTLERAVHD